MILLPSISYEDSIELPSPTFVDIRSQQEFNADHIPGAINVPLFSDEDRSIIGTIYRKEGLNPAFEKGIEFTKRSAHTLLNRFLEAVGRNRDPAEIENTIRRADLFFSNPRNIHEELGLQRISHSNGENFSEGEIIVYCFRGGLRSRSFIYFLREVGIKALHLSEGYKNFRRFVVDKLKNLDLPPIVTLQGLTGAGKTLILQALSNRFPGCVIDLEDLAGHRSSILGAIGKTPKTKKMFDSLLLDRIYPSKPAFFLVEGESRKIGDIEIPSKFFQAMEEGTHILVEASVNTRARILVQEYITEETVDEILQQIETLENRIGKKTLTNLTNLIKTGNYKEAARILLEKYYDPLYRHTLKKKVYNLKVDSMNFPKSVEKISSFLRNSFSGNERFRGENLSVKDKPGKIHL